MDVLLTRVQHQIEADFPDLGISDLRVIGRGPVFTVIKGVIRGRTKGGHSVGVRIAPEQIETEGPHPVNAHDLLVQECLMSTHCRAHDLPAPEIIGQSHKEDQANGLDLFVYEWLDDDNHPPEPYHMGDVLHRLHEMNPPAFEPVVMRGSTFEKVLSHRILDAAATVTRLTNRPLAMPGMEKLQAHLSWPDKRTSLLHMDFRPVNLHAAGGRICGIMGWCEALIGPPTLELVRLDELDVLDDSFLGGYANYEMFKAPKPVETAFRMDTAVRHAEALLHEAPGSTEAQKAVNRVAFLFDEFDRLSGGLS